MQQCCIQARPTQQWHSWYLCYQHCSYIKCSQHVRNIGTTLLTPSPEHLLPTMFSFNYVMFNSAGNTGRTFLRQQYTATLNISSSHIHNNFGVAAPLQTVKMFSALLVSLCFMKFCQVKLRRPPFPTSLTYPGSAYSDRWSIRAVKSRIYRVTCLASGFECSLVITVQGFLNIQEF